MRVAIVGSGIAGLTCAHVLSRKHDVTLYENDDELGGHARTVRVDLTDSTHFIDVGFLVYHERTYPLFSQLLESLAIAHQPSEMSFSVSDREAELEWRGSSLSSVFADRRNILRYDFLRMLVDIGRFNRLAGALLRSPRPPTVTLQDFIDEHHWSPRFLEWYLLPLGASIWSANPSTFAGIPVMAFASFLERHGMLAITGASPWRTITGGSQHYVNAIAAPLFEQGRVRLSRPVEKLERTTSGVELLARGEEPTTFDHVILATHSDQALALLSDPSAAEVEILQSIRFQQNRVTLHSDGRLLPTNKRAQASWNYLLPRQGEQCATLTYDIARLQSIEAEVPLLVTLNSDNDIDGGSVIESFDFAHPILDRQAIAAQQRWSEINGVNGTWFCGAYWGYGFHEDGIRSAMEICKRFGETL